MFAGGALPCGGTLAGGALPCGVGAAAAGGNGAADPQGRGDAEIRGLADRGAPNPVTREVRSEVLGEGGWVGKNLGLAGLREPAEPGLTNKDPGGPARGAQGNVAAASCCQLANIVDMDIRLGPSGGPLDGVNTTEDAVGTAAAEAGGKSTPR